MFAYLFHRRRYVYTTKNISLLLPTCHAHVVVFLMVSASVPFVDIFDAYVIFDSFFFKQTDCHCADSLCKPYFKGHSFNLKIRKMGRRVAGGNFSTFFSLWAK